jgi:hypothetical protein
MSSNNSSPQNSDSAQCALTPTEGYSTVDLGINHSDSSACCARKIPAMIISLNLLEKGKEKQLHLFQVD